MNSEFGQERGSVLEDEEDTVFSQNSDFDLFEKRFSHLDLDESDESENGEGVVEEILPEHACR